MRTVLHSESVRLLLARRIPSLLLWRGLLACSGSACLIADTVSSSRTRSEGPEAKARKIIKTDNFTGQTNTVDVDKHMCVCNTFPAFGCLVSRPSS